MLRPTVHSTSDLVRSARVRLRGAALWLARMRVHGGLAALLLSLAFAWAVDAIQMQPARADVGHITGRSLQVERAAVLGVAMPQLTAPAPRVRPLAPMPLGLIAFAVAVAQAAPVDAPNPREVEPIWQWLRRARRLPRSDCSEPDRRA